MDQDQKVDEAPNFSGTYPGAGERLGPAWRWIWIKLSDGRWVCGLDLAHEMTAMRWGGPDAARGGRLSAKTVINLLVKARDCGILRSTMRRPGYGSLDQQRNVFRNYYARADITEAPWSDAHSTKPARPATGEAS